MELITLAKAAKMGKNILVIISQVFPHPRAYGLLLCNKKVPQNHHQHKKRMRDSDVRFSPDVR